MRIENNIQVNKISETIHIDEFNAKVETVKKCDKIKEWVIGVA